MELQKSWSTLEIKAIDDGTRTIRGIASTPSTDRAGDIVEPGGAKFTLPIPLLSQHDHASPIGSVTAAVVTPHGIEIEATIPKNSGLDYVEKAWLQIKSGLVRGLSIGFQGTKVEPIKGGLKFKEWSWLELSAVTIPCNQDANIMAVKQYAANPYSEDEIESADSAVRLEPNERAAAALKSSLSVIHKNPWSKS